jgi:aldehyde:ferredoxin oxidoreductase
MTALDRIRGCTYSLEARASDDVARLRDIITGGDLSAEDLEEAARVLSCTGARIQCVIEALEELARHLAEGGRR